MVEGLLFNSKATFASKLFAKIVTGGLGAIIETAISTEPVPPRGGGGVYVMTGNALFAAINPAQFTVPAVVCEPKVTVIPGPSGYEENALGSAWGVNALPL